MEGEMGTIPTVCFAQREVASWLFARLFSVAVAAFRIYDIARHLLLAFLFPRLMLSARD